MIEFAELINWVATTDPELDLSELGGYLMTMTSANFEITDRQRDLAAEALQTLVPGVDMLLEDFARLMEFASKYRPGLTMDQIVPALTDIMIDDTVPNDMRQLAVQAREIIEGPK